MKTSTGKYLSFRADRPTEIITGHPHEGAGGACPDCGTEATHRECEDCDAHGWIINCGHMAQPRPLAAAADGSGRCLCDDCAVD